METIEFYTKALETNPENAGEYYWERAELYFDNFEMEKALSDYEKAIELGLEEVKKDECYLTCLDYKNSDKTIATLTQKIEKEPNADSYLQRSYLYELKQEYDKSFADLSMAINLQPDNTSLYTCRAELCKEIAKFDYTKAIECSPEDSSCYLNRAEFYTKLGDLEKAEIDYNNAVEIDSSEYTYGERAGFYQQFECYNEAIEDYTTAIEFCKENSEALEINTIEDLYVGIAGYYHDRAECYQKLEQYENAISDYDKTIEYIKTSNIPEEYKDAEIEHVQAHINDCNE